MRSRALVRIFRAVAIFIAAWLIHDAHESDAPNGSSISIEDARRLFPDAARFGRRHVRLGAQEVLDAADQSLGFALRTSPASDELIGYAGPSDLLVGLGLDGRIERVRLSSSADTRAHVEAVLENDAFWRSFEGSHPSRPVDIDAVSGSTLTSLAMAEGVERRLSDRVRSLRFPEPLERREVVNFFQRAKGIVPREDGWNEVVDDAGEILGYALRSAPHADSVVGYSGPTEVVIGVSKDRRDVLGVRLRASYDTEEYVQRVRNDEDFLEQLAARDVAEWLELDYDAAGIEGVSGATQTSYAIAESVRQRLSVDTDSSSSEGRMWGRDLALVMIVIGALAMTFGTRRSDRKLRRAWQIVLVVGFGLALGDLLSLALLDGWSRHGAPLSAAPVLCVLAAVSLIIPWSTKKQIYCHSLCPHGAAQEWISSFKTLRRPLPARVTRTLSRLPALTLACAFLCALFLPSFDLANLEAFDAWALGVASAVSLALLALGLVACLFVPMAYCRFACPTGALLEFVRARGSTEGFRVQDAVAAALLAVGAAASWFASPSIESVQLDDYAAHGHAFGTSWSVRLRDGQALPLKVAHEIEDELERIEARLSSWRPRSEVSQFNAAETTFELAISEELRELVAYALELSAKSGGAFDITLGRLIDAWGVGPSGKREQRPSMNEILALLERCSWTKLDLDRESSVLRKLHPQLELDLGALLHGYAADRIGEILESSDTDEFLIDVGGELLARGRWMVAIESPFDPLETLTQFELEDGALATSGSYRMSHIISAETGWPVESQLVLCAVTAKSALAADGWSTALFAAGERALALARDHELEVVLVRTDGTRVGTGPFESR